MTARGRPAKGKERPTSQVRMYTDQVQMLGWVARLSGISTAAVLDQFLSEKLTKKYFSIMGEALAVKSAEDAARKRLGLEPTPPLPAPRDIPSFLGQAIDKSDTFPTMAPPGPDGVIDLTADLVKAKKRKPRKKKPGPDAPPK